MICTTIAAALFCGPELFDISPWDDEKKKSPDGESHSLLPETTETLADSNWTIVSALRASYQIS